MNYTEKPSHIRLSKMEPASENDTHPMVAIKDDNESNYDDDDTLFKGSLTASLALALCLLLLLLALAVSVCGRRRRKALSDAQLDAHLARERRQVAAKIRARTADAAAPAVLHVEMSGLSHIDDDADANKASNEENRRSNSVYCIQDENTKNDNKGDEKRVRASEPNVRYIFRHTDSPSTSVEEADHEVAGINGINGNNYKTFSSSNPLAQRLDTIVANTPPLKQEQNKVARKIELVDTPDCTSIDTAIPEDSGKFGDDCTRADLNSSLKDSDSTLNQMELAVEEGIEKWSSDKSAEDVDRASEIHSSPDVDMTNPWANDDGENKKNGDVVIQCHTMTTVATSS